MLKYWLTATFFVAAILLMSVRAFADFVYYTAEEFARRCPVIVAGVITDTDDDRAYIKVEAIFKNILRDVELKAGDVLPVRMSPDPRRIVDGEVVYIATGDDLRYGKGTDGIWLIYLHNKSYGFTIEWNPVQLQSLANEERLRANGAFSTEKEVLPDGKHADRLYSTDEWIAKINPAMKAIEGQGEAKMPGKDK